MNLYLRYFTNETLAHSVDEALDFLRSLHEINVDASLEKDIRQYAASDVRYPKRYKVRPRVYFIVIKTDVDTLTDFKLKKGLHAPADAGRKANLPLVQLNIQREGWYEGSLDFKRVVLLPASGKHEYRDTHFTARCKAVSGQDCYDRIVDYLRSRVDSRSQFPSAKGKNFSFKFLGLWK